MATAINPDTFERTGEEVRETKRYRFVYDTGSVEVTLGDETRRVPATRLDGRITASGMYGTYRTSPRRWPAIITLDPDGREFAGFGRDERSGRCNKMRGLAFGEA